MAKAYALLAPPPLPRKLRSSPHGQVLINMSLALLALYITFIVAGHVTTVAPLCGVLSALLHYLLLALFGWMAVEALLLYRKLVVVMEGGWRNLVPLAGAAAWSEHGGNASAGLWASPQTGVQPHVVTESWPALASGVAVCPPLSASSV